MKNLFRKGPTTRADVLFALAGALAAAWKANDTIKQYKADQAALTEKKENKK